MPWCLLVIQPDTYIMADPLRGIYEYDKEVVEERYKDMGRQAIVIY